jgi:hypothetical protein
MTFTATSRPAQVPLYTRPAQWERQKEAQQSVAGPAGAARTAPVGKKDKHSTQLQGCDSSAEKLSMCLTASHETAAVYTTAFDVHSSSAVFHTAHSVGVVVTAQWSARQVSVT